MIVFANMDAKKVRVLQYSSKLIRKQPVLLQDITLEDTPLKICLLRDLLIVMFATKLQAYHISTSDEISLKE